MSNERFTTTPDGTRLCLETFGADRDPAVLLIAGGGESMDFWADGFCRMLAGGGRFVVRYDHRDVGRSTSYPAGKPGYGWADLAADAMAVLDELGAARAHLVGMSMGGSLARLPAAQHPERVVGLTIFSGSPAGPGDDELPGPTPELAAAYADASPEPDWTDPDAVVAHLVADLRRHTGTLPFDEAAAGELARRVIERSTDPGAAANHFLVAGDEDPAGGPAVDLGAIAVPTLVLHGTADPLFPYPHGASLAAAIPRARLVAEPGVGHEHPPPALWPMVVAELLTHTAQGWEPDHVGADPGTSGDAVATNGGPTTSTGHRIVTRAQWRAERVALLADEKELTRRVDAVTARREALPWVPVEKSYRFTTPAGPATLLDLFRGRTQLIAYHMMPPGCPACSSVIDGLDGVRAHLEGHDVAVVVTCRRPIEELVAYRDRMGWGVAVVSAEDGELHQDMGVYYTDAQLAAGPEHNFRRFPPTDRWPNDVPGMSAFARDGENVFHTYSANARGLDVLNGALQWLDRTPSGRNHQADPGWLRLRDEYPQR